MDFPCSGCGLCCRKIKNIVEDANSFEPLPVLYKAIKEFPYTPNTDGSCPMLYENKCSVYAQRPLLCDIKKLGELLDMDLYTWYKVNSDCCNELIKAENFPDSYLVKL